MASSMFGVMSAVLFGILFHADGAKTEYTAMEVAARFTGRIFDKYGTIGRLNITVIKTTGLNDLMQSLSLGSIKVVCQLNDTECLKNQFVGHNTTRKDPLLSIKRRSVDDAQSTTSHDMDWKRHLERCMTLNNVKSLYKINESGFTKTDFRDICPTLLQQIDEKACIHYHKRFPRLVEPEGPPSSSETWGYGFLAITICSLSSLAVIAMIPCLKKSFYNMVMAYLIALAVGTLAGDALLHLLPHTLIEGANLAAGITVSEEQSERQHRSMVWRSAFVLVGIYIFFLVEQVMKLRATCCHTSRHGHHDHQVQMESPAEGYSQANHDDKENDSADHGVTDGHGHSHGADKTITRETNIASVAWMVIVGDGFHNFSDGLAVGAAFSASISSGVSTTIAIFCHELPHELGDFAILIKSGMSIKQAIVYNLVSAVLAYLGLAIGIVAGAGELGRHIILSLTAGLFLYISLADMMGELTEHAAAMNKCCTVICQHLGLLSGIAIMLVISLYE